MGTKHLFVILWLGIFNIGIAQVTVPEAYMGKFPYYVGHTRLEAEQYSGKNRYLILVVDPLQIDTIGSSDVSAIIQSVIDQAFLKTGPDTFVTVLLPAGKLRIEQTLKIPSHVVLKGHGARTTLLLATGENRHGILISPANLTPLFRLPLAKHAGRGSREVYVDKQKLAAYVSINGMPRYLTLTRLDDDELITSAWAKGSVSEHYYNGGVRDSASFSIITLSHPLSALQSIPAGTDISMETRTDFGADSLSELCFLPYVEHAGVQCLSIQRLDSTTSQTSNIMLDQVYNCLVSEVYSTKTNFAHICVNNSAFNIVKRCRLSQSFGYGDGGRAYGVVLQMGSASNVVMDNYFSTLRHSMLLQAGANNNVLFANVSVSTFWNEGVFPSDASGDIVLHGNYVYGNLAEMNSVQQLVIDDSHGKNGPRNIFYRNQLRNYGVLMSAENGSDSQVFFANEIMNTEALKGFFLLKDKGHFIYGNQVKGQLPAGQTDMTYPAFIFQPPCYKLGKVSPACFRAWPAFGAPFSTSDDKLPASLRIQSFDTGSCTADYDIQYAFTSGLERETDAKDGFLYYPNPAHAALTVEVVNPGILSVFDTRGNRVYTITVSLPGRVVDLAGFSRGLYILRYIDQDGMVMVRKLLIQ